MLVCTYATRPEACSSTCQMSNIVHDNNVSKLFIFYPSPPPPPPPSHYFKGDNKVATRGGEGSGQREESFPRYIEAVCVAVYVCNMTVGEHVNMPNVKHFS